MIECDVLIIGGGAAGVRAAIAALEQGASTVLVSKGPVGRSGATPTAGRGFQLPFPDRDPRNNAHQHYLDNLAGGLGIAEPSLARLLAESSRERVLQLEEYGIPLKKEGEDFLVLHDPGQTYPRSLLIPSMRSFMTGLLKRARESGKFTLLEDVMALDLVEDGDAVRGAIAWDTAQGRLLCIRSKATVLATGGYQAIFPLTGAPDAIGDGQALAFRAGAELVDMEMVKFYPTSVVSPVAAQGTHLYYEYLLHTGYIPGSLVDKTGRVVMPPSDPAPLRDAASRTILEARREGRRVMLDLTTSGLSEGELRKRLMDYCPHPYSYLLDLGVDIASQQVEVAPDAGYALGGVKINARCETGISGLYAAGEVTGGVHGANRVSSNALTECLVFGEVAGRTAGEAARSCRPGTGSFDTGRWERKIEGLLTREAGHRPHELRRRLHQVTELALVGSRDEKRLERGLRELQEVEGLAVRCSSRETRYNKELLDALEWESLLLCARLAMLAAGMRKESRGNHQREDYPERDDANWKAHTAARLSEGSIRTHTIPIDDTDN